MRSEFYFQIGTVFLQADDPTQAEACFKSMLAMEPDNTQGLFGLGMSYGTQGRWTEAQVELQRVVDREPNNEDARRWMMLSVERSSGNPGTAKAPPRKTIPRAGSLRV
jgi:Tfp pilus assembly protein PilF